MEYSHTSVMLNETLDMLNLERNLDGVYLDGTLGGAGHSRELLSRLSNNGSLICIDRDRAALENAGRILYPFFGKYILVHGNFRDAGDIIRKLNIENISGAILDLGVSSHQLDNPERGFSYMENAKLDMRMNSWDELTAYDVVNEYDPEILAGIIYKNSDERWAKRIAEFVAAERRIKPIETTRELVSVIKKAIPKSARQEGPHPARRTFLAIRREVNGEISALEKSIYGIAEALEPGGRLCIISFDSIEDRTVKNAFRKLENPCVCPPEFPICVCGGKPTVRIVTKRPLAPSEGETAANRRSRSAKLRVCEKL